MADMKHDTQNTIRKRRLAWFTNVCRLPDNKLVKRSLTEDFEKKKGRGRPPKDGQISSKEIRH